MTSRFQFENGQPKLKEINQFINELSTTGKKYEIAQEYRLTIHSFPFRYTPLQWVQNKFPEFPLKHQKLVVYYCSL